MLTLRQSSFDQLQSDLFRKLEQQLHTAERVPAAEVRETPEAYTIAVELPGVDKASIDVKATDRTLVISAERQAVPADASESSTLLSEVRYGTWSRSFRFPAGINRDALEAHYRDGLLTVTAAKAQTLTTVQVKVEG
ncbi:MAG: Hsp20/alpha crystallin family protein [Synechococcaceae bacterium WB9_2_170]|jgi:HSP20 family protein|nr:Hsp20/alpha crystallin family protein [Synechococcaceae bacterium WB9_2_170]